VQKEGIKVEEEFVFVLKTRPGNELVAYSTIETRGRLLYTPPKNISLLLHIFLNFQTNLEEKTKLSLVKIKKGWRCYF